MAKVIVSIRDLNLEIQDHDFVVLAGPSGGGGSALLRMIAGLEKISQGDIFIGERRVNDLPPKDRDVAMVFENFALYPRMSVSGNLAFGLKLRKFSKPEIKRRVLDAAGVLGIEELLEEKARSLTPEQSQRVALGRAIVRQPKVFLFDEPLARLEAKARVQLRTEITKLHQRLQATMIYVTHDQAEAMALGRRIAALHHGVVQQHDTALTLYSEPANLFVAGYFGSPPMNFLRGALKQERDALVFSEMGDGTIQARLPAAGPGAREFAGQPMILGIRPDDIEVARSEGVRENSGASFPAIVDIVQPMGGAAHLHLQTGAHTVVCRSQRAFAHEEAGRRLRFEMNLSKAHLFDPVSTLRVGRA